MQVKGVTHYGRFAEVERPARSRHTWVAPHMVGLESIAPLTFKKKGGSTIMTFVHSAISGTQAGRKHEQA